MNTPDYDDPKVVAAWCAERRAGVLAYLAQEGVSHGRVGVWPAWHAAPLVSVWAVESRDHPDWVGWWAISGDLPTDYVSAHHIMSPRAAMSAIASNWFELSACMARGEAHPDTELGSPETWPELVPILRSSATLLADFVIEDPIWKDTKES